jgi:hypothetical protein
MPDWKGKGVPVSLVYPPVINEEDNNNWLRSNYHGTSEHGGDDAQSQIDAQCQIDPRDQIDAQGQFYPKGQFDQKFRLIVNFTLRVSLISNLIIIMMYCQFAWKD